MDSYLYGNDVYSSGVVMFNIDLDGVSMNVSGKSFYEALSSLKTSEEAQAFVGNFIVAYRQTLLNEMN